MQPIQQGQQGQQGQQYQPFQTQQTSAQPSLMDLVNRLSPQETAPAPNPTDPTQFAQDFIASMMATPETNFTTTAPRINPDALREAFGVVDFTTGLDIGQLTEALQGRGAADADPAALTRQALQTQGLNIITAVAPLLNQMVQAAMERAVAQSTQQAQHGMTSQSLVGEFLALHPYAKSPLMMNMVTQFCNTIVAQNPTTINRGEIFKALDLVFQGMSQSIRPDRLNGGDNLPSNAQTGFSDVFR